MFGTVGVSWGVELQIGKWKGKEDFKVIHLDDYDFALGLNFLDKIKACIFPFSNWIHIFDDLQSQCIFLVNCDMKVGTKVLLAIQLIEDLS